MAVHQLDTLSWSLFHKALAVLSVVRQACQVQMLAWSAPGSEIQTGILRHVNCHVLMQAIQPNQNGVLAGTAEDMI